MTMMLATFYGGPADGGALRLMEPIPSVLRLPLDPRLLEPAAYPPVDSPCWQSPAIYELDLDGRGEPNYVYGPGGNRLVRYRAHSTHKKPSSA